RVIEARKPDRVCVELDEKRLETLARQRQWESLDLRALIRTKRLSALLAALLLHSYQKRLGDRLGVIPGLEMLEAVRTAEALGIPLALCDRDIRVTMRRAWRATPFLQKGLLVSALLYSIFDTTEMSEETLRKLRQQDVISEVMRELGEEVPSLKRVLVDERDIYLAHRIGEAEGRLVVAVVGAGHIEGIRGRLLQEPAGAPAPSLIAELDTIPPMRPIWKWVGWAIPAIILGSIAWIGFQKGAEAAWANAQYWVLANGIPSAMGAILAAAHPATILAAFLAAPLTSLTPVIGVGYVVAFVQAYVQPPVVREFQTVADDIGVLRQWWRNRLLRILLAFVLTTLGSVLGTWVGGTAIIANLF
ncbi:MAG: TraB/GumN family protein, partial [Nitrospirales bacterium]